MVWALLCSVTNARGTSGEAGACAALAVTLTQPSLTRVSSALPLPLSAFSQMEGPSTVVAESRGFFFWLELNLVWQGIVFVIKSWIWRILFYLCFSLPYLISTLWVGPKTIDDIENTLITLFYGFCFMSWGLSWGLKKKQHLFSFWLENISDYFIRKIRFKVWNFRYLWWMWWNAEIPRLLFAIKTTCPGCPFLTMSCCWARRCRKNDSVWVCWYQLYRFLGASAATLLEPYFPLV